MEDRLFDDSQQVYVVDPKLNGVDSSVLVSGWELLGSHAEVVTHDYPIFDQSYSRFQYHIEIRRSVVSSILKSLLPAIFIVLGGFVAFLLAPDKAVNRLTINTAALTGAILFHVNLTSQVPPVGSLTYADKFMIVNYIGLGAALVSTVALLVMQDRKQDAKAKRIHNVTRAAVPLAWALLQFGLVFTL